MRTTNPKGQYTHGQQVDSLRTVTTYADICVAIVDDDESFCRSVRRRLPVSAFDAATVQLAAMSGLEMQRRLTARGI